MKKRIKTVAVVLFCAIWIWGDSFNQISILKAKEQNYDGCTYEEIVEIQKNAVLANEALINAFEHAETIVYPDDYAGDYIDYDKLVVVLTEDADMVFYRNVLEKYLDWVVFRESDVSLNELINRADEFCSMLPEGSFVSAGIRPDLEAFHIEALSSYREKVMNLLGGDYEIEESEYAGVKCEKVVFDHAYITFTDNLPSLASTATAGSGVHNKNNNGVINSYSTLSGNGSFTWNGTTSNAFLVAGHAIDSTNCLLFQGTSYMETLQYRQFVNNGYGDFAITSMTSTYYPTPLVQVTASTSVPFVGYVLNPAVNTVVSTYGKTSGAASGSVVEKGVTANYAYANTTITIKGLSKIYISSGTCANGDSGGPVKVGNAFSGLISGSGTENLIPYILFTPYYYIKQAGFNICSL